MAALADRLEAALSARARRVFPPLQLGRAAVLIPLLQRPPGPTLLFTRRTETISHPGQVSFPGGRLEGGEDAPAAALREAEEEVGLNPGRVRVLGLLDDRLSINRLHVTPVVGWVEAPPERFVGNAREVTEPFEVGLEWLRNPAHVRVETRSAEGLPPGWTEAEMARLGPYFREVDAGGTTFSMPRYEGERGQVIWGLTAVILRQLLDESLR